MTEPAVQPAPQPLLLPGSRMVLATHNPGKLAEFRGLLHPYGLVLANEAVAVPVTAETGQTFVQNAWLKARAAALATGLPALADDSGLCIDALAGAPGVASAPFADQHGGYPAVFAELDKRLAGQENRSARFCCVLVLALPDGREALGEGELVGSIVLPPRGTGGFGYDPIFQPAGYTQTLAELGTAEKNRISHRQRAFAMLAARAFACP